MVKKIKAIEILKLSTEIFLRGLSLIAEKFISKRYKLVKDFLQKSEDKINN